MRALIISLISLAFAVGCAHRKHTEAYSNAQPPILNQPVNGGASNRLSGLIITPENLLIGKVAMVNPGGRFVVINFPLGRMPLIDQHMSLYRRGLKVGEVKITGPQQDDNIVGDLINGESEQGDEARAQ